MPARTDDQIRDFADFYEKWPAARAGMLDLERNAALDHQQRVYLGWLIRLADRVGPADISATGGHHGQTD